MKQFFSALLFLLFAAVVQAQAPQSINYQGIARNSAGVAYAAQAVGIRLSVRTNSVNGAVEYSETRSVTTNSFGLFNIQVGSAGATNVQGNFATIDWSNGLKFLQTEISVNNQPYTSLGTTQMISVPYAINSLQSRQLVFPFDTTVNSNSAAAFGITNTAAGQFPAIRGESINGEAITGTSEKKSGVSGYSQAVGVGGITGANPAVGGYGVHGYTSATNTSGAGVFGTALNGIGVRGETAFGSGVFGFASASGTAIRALAYGQGNGLYASVASGTAISALATSADGTAGNFQQSNTGGLALNIVGNLKLAGGNTNPGAGKILTSDAAGNATWQNAPVVNAPKVAFKIKDVFPGGLNNYSETNWFKVYFNTEEYDYGNNISVGGTTANSVFTAPYTGVYHFDASVGVRTDGIFCWIELVKQNIAGEITSIKTSVYAETLMDNPANVSQRQSHSVSTDTKLDAGDKVFARFRWLNGHVSDSQLNGISATSGGAFYVSVTQFSGHMVFAD